MKRKTVLSMGILWIIQSICGLVLAGSESRAPSKLDKPDLPAQAVKMEAAPIPKGAESRNLQKVPSDQMKPRIMPDFKVSKVFIAPYTPNPPAQFSPLNRNVRLGEKVYLICEMTNIGSNHQGLWSIGFFVDGQAAWNNRWGDLAAGKGLTGVGVYTAGQEGVHQYECVLDYLNEVAEKEEKSNNKMGLSFRVGK